MIVRVEDLPDGILTALTERIEQVFPVRQQDGDEHAGYHGNGVYFECGVLYYHLKSYVDTLVHEAAHAMLIPPGKRATWSSHDVATDEDQTMVIQVELCRRLPGLGVRFALAQLEEVCYGYGHTKAGNEVASAWAWWRRHRLRDVPLPWIAAAGEAA